MQICAVPSPARSDLPPKVLRQFHRNPSERDRDTDTRGEPTRTNHPRSNLPQRMRRQSVAPEYPAAIRESECDPARPSGSNAPRQRIRSTHRAWWQRIGILAPRLASGPRGPRVATPRRSIVANQSGKPSPPFQYQFLVRAKPSRPGRVFRLPSASLRPPDAVDEIGCHDAKRLRPLPPTPLNYAQRVPQAAWVFTIQAWNDAAAPGPQCACRSPPTFHWRRRVPVARRHFDSDVQAAASCHFDNMRSLNSARP